MYSLVLLAALPGQFVENAEFSRARQLAAYEATVRIYHPASRSAGTAVAVARHGNIVYLLTAAHLVPAENPVRPTESVKKVELYLYTAASHPRLSSERLAAVTARMPNVDLAVLEADLPGFPGVVPIRPKGLPPLRLPMNVMTVGALQDGPPEIALDVVKERKLLKKPDGTEAFYWQAEIPQRIGRSGGPMIDTDGQVIGIASGTWHEKGYYSYINELHRALADCGYGWLSEPPADRK